MIGRMCKVGDGLSRPVLIARKTFSYRKITHIEVISIELFYFEIFSQVIYAAVIAVRNHLFPFRTEKLSSPSPMVLPHQVGE